MMRRVLFCFLLAIPLLSQAGPAEESWNAWLTGDFERVSSLADTRGSDTTISVSARALIYMALGCSEAMRGRSSVSADAFRVALQLDPRLDYTADELPPPVWAVFKKERDASRLAIRLQPQPIQGRHDTVKVATPIYRSRDDVMFSLVAPGYGQIRDGHKWGYAVLGSEICLAAGWAIAANQTSHARRSYLRASGSTEIQSTYHRYNRDYQVSTGLGVAVVLLYIGAQYDYFSRPPPLLITLSCGQSDLKVGVALTL